MNEVVFCLKANMKAPHKFIRRGALCWVTFTNPGSAGDKIKVLCISKGGRTVHTFTSAQDLCNFRAAFAPEHIRKHLTYSLQTKEYFTEVAESFNERYGNQPIRDKYNGVRNNNT